MENGFLASKFLQIPPEQHGSYYRDYIPPEIPIGHLIGMVEVDEGMACSAC